MRAAGRAALLASAALIAMPAAAQVLPGAVQPGRDRPGPATPSQPDFDFSIVTPHRSAVPRAVDEVHFKLSDVKIVGAKTIAAAYFRPLYAGLIGKDITLGDILDIADKIEDAYRTRGYLLVRAFVPPQRVRDGVFTINVVEGYLANVTVQGGRRGAQRLVRAYLAPATSAHPLTLAAMERGLLLTNDIPGVSASGVLKPSASLPGASDLVVDIDQPPVSGGLAVDNRGSHFSGLWTVSGDVEFNGLLGEDQLAATVVSSPDSLRQIEGTVRYRRAIGGDGLIGSLIGTVTHGEPGSLLSVAGVLTHSWAAGARLTYPLIRSRAQTLLLDGGFTAQDATVNVSGLGHHLSHDQWRVIDLGASYQQTGLLGGGIWTTTFDIARGLSIFGATDDTVPAAAPPHAPQPNPDLSRFRGKTDFTKFTAGTRLLLPIGGNFSTALNVQGQFALDRLITGEQIAFGGTQIGRGYDPGAITGDHGVGGSAELRYDFRFADSVVRAVEPYVYVDGAQTWYFVDPSLPNQTLLSAGGGFRFWLPYNLTGAIEGSRMLRAVPGSDLGRKATKVLFDLSVRF
ncbi:MAG TPA: ShlB/FhaC/HecB family hemolysin secretion/activation protein [Rhizomicrobium sp.]